MSLTTKLCMLLIALVSASVPLTVTLELGGRASAAQGSKLIALTFDDGPKPYVLMVHARGREFPRRACSLYSISKT